MAKEIVVCKASPLQQDIIEDEDVVLKIEGDIFDKMPLSMPNHQVVDVYLDQAKKIMEALDVLPQGTRNKLLILMLEEHPIYYRGK